MFLHIGLSSCNKIWQDDAKELTVKQLAFENLNFEIQHI